VDRSQDIATFATATDATAVPLGAGREAPPPPVSSLAPGVLRPPSRSRGVARTWRWLSLDILLLVVANVCALIQADRSGLSLASAAALAVNPLLAIALFYRHGLYRRRLGFGLVDGLAHVISAISTAAITLIAGVVIVSGTAVGTHVILAAWMLSVVFVGTGRFSLAWIERQVRRRGDARVPALIVGAGKVGAEVARRLEENPECGLDAVGFIDSNPLVTPDAGAPVLGGLHELARVAAQTGARHVIVAFSAVPDCHLAPLVRECCELRLDVSLVPRLFESMSVHTELDRLGVLPLLDVRGVDPKGWQFAVKHGIDRALAALALLLAAPLMLALALLVRLSSPGPVLFRQRRTGRDGRTFTVLKFRSMRPEPAGRRFAPAKGIAPGGVEGIDRRTTVGRWLRRSGLDELPQLINVLRGEMSLVGPRPERPEFVEEFEFDLARYADRHRVKSGITGWAQVHGLRGQTSLEDRVALDNYYIENWSLLLDFKVMLLTLPAMIRSGES
jgi:exopolysaccharide biosynthesis polyprenyl glycosylphosphotransferase